MQYFKGDDLELKFDASASPLLTGISLQLDNFLAGLDHTGPLGDMLFTTARAPLSNAIAQSIFRLAFKEIFAAFVSVGTYEAYLTVFKKIFGTGVVVNFTVPAPGRLQISIAAPGVELTNFATRYILNNHYVLDETITEGADHIVFQSIKGFTSQYELQQMLFEMVPGGIYTEITLTLA